MTAAHEVVKEAICRAMCQDVTVLSRGGMVQVSLPFIGRDGDGYCILVQQNGAGWRVHDAGSTLMRLSYENDLGNLLDGSRGRLYKQILGETGLGDDDGMLYLDVNGEKLVDGLFRFGQALTRVSDLALWTKARTESTFYDDLASSLRQMLPDSIIEKDYLVPDLADAGSYPVDFYIHTNGTPLFVFGVGSGTKAKLTTIVLERLLREGVRFDSLVVFQDMKKVPKPDVSRLMNAANEMIASEDATEDLRRKLIRKIA